MCSIVLFKLFICVTVRTKTNKIKNPYVICNLHMTYESLYYQLVLLACSDAV